MTCQDCAAAEKRIWPTFTAGCPGCRARAVARSPQCWDAARLGRQTNGYRELLRRMDVTHEQVKEAAELDVMCGGGAKANA